MVLLLRAAIMPVMDHKPIEDLLTELETVDPADAPEVADAIASELSSQLESEDGDRSETPS